MTLLNCERFEMFYGLKEASPFLLSARGENERCILEPVTSFPDAKLN